MYLQCLPMCNCKHDAWSTAALPATSMGLGFIKGGLQMRWTFCFADNSRRTALSGAVIRGDVPGL